MARSSLRMNELRRNMSLITLLLFASALNAGVSAEDEPVAAVTAASQGSEFVRGDMIPEEKTEEPATEEGQVMVLPTPGLIHPSTAAPTQKEGSPASNDTEGTTVERGTQTQAVTKGPGPAETQTQGPQSSRGDGPDKPPQFEVVCVSKEAVEFKDAVSLKLKTSSSCEESRTKIASVLQQLCGEDCKLDLYQEQGSTQVLVSGQYVEADAVAMADKFNNDNIKDKIDVEEASPRVVKGSKMVLVSLLISGLLLAALLVAGYYFKTHRKSSKGVRLAESFQVDEENQANTLVSVAPLPQDPLLEKPAATNGAEPLPENPAPPATNGHAPNQTPVADTEM
ncbi:uncharacterized protein si:ch211-286o17.1 [Gadus macrocephalus]|uniref:uncharacterized protein si:ch211-286o17.1 n=1 Tax=Gadus macrocephalus TaxID=80720 RepID=UPI0028CB6998|nr:uncharacterized protein si:ch211-286o17.1 [Gadus macrocephalus]